MNQDILFYVVCASAVALGVYALWMIIKTRHANKGRRYVGGYGANSIKRTVSSNPSSTWANLKRETGQSGVTIKDMKKLGFWVKELD